MAEIVEVLTQQNVAGGDERYSFTVNTAVASVGLAAGPALPRLRSANNPALGDRYPNFTAQDNIRLLSCGLWLPYSFALSVVPVRVLLYWVDPLGLTMLPVLGPDATNTALWVPDAGYELALDRYSAYPAAIGPTAGLVAFLMDPGAAAADQLGISQLNTPAILNATVQRVVFWVKVMHSLSMVP
jgi:hypothetical protein